MSIEVPRRSYIRFLKSIGAGVTAILSLVTALFTLVNLVQGNDGILTQILLIAAVAFLWLSCAFIYFSKVVQKVWVRRAALAGFIAVPILILSAIGYVGWIVLQTARGI